MLPRQLLYPFICIFFLLSCNSNTGENEKGTFINTSVDKMIVAKRTIEELMALRVEKHTCSKRTRAAKKITTSLISYSSLDEDLVSLQKKPEEFIIDVSRDTTLLCKEGTLLKINHASFVDETGKEPAGRIRFLVKEFYNLADIIMNRLSTASGGQLLETGGTVFIEAFAGEQRCELKRDSAIEISFPFVNKKDDMQLFTGNRIDNKIDWVIGAELKEENPAVDKLAEFPGGTRALTAFCINNISSPDLIYATDTISSYRFPVQIVIDENGFVKDINVKSNPGEDYRESVVKAISKMPRWKPAERNGRTVKSTFALNIIFYSEGDELTGKEYKDKFEASVSDSSLNTVPTSGINYYVLSTSKLSWINCDRFYKSNKRKTVVYVNTGKNSDMDVKIIFHSFKSILDGTFSEKGFAFDNIPVDEPVTVVAVKKINNDTFISITESNTSKENINNLYFEKVTMPVLKEKLQQLNKLAAAL